jgi:hypothetical protein
VPAVLLTSVATKTEESFNFCGLPSAVSLIISAAIDLPVDRGAKIIEILRLAPFGGSSPRQFWLGSSCCGS